MPFLAMKHGSLCFYKAIYSKTSGNLRQINLLKASQVSTGYELGSLDGKICALTTLSHQISLLHICRTFVVVTCGSQPFLDNGGEISRTIGSYGGGYDTYNTTIQYQCNIGYWFSPGVFTQSSRCLSSGNWSSIGICKGEEKQFIVFKLTIYF